MSTAGTRTRTSRRPGGCRTYIVFDVVPSTAGQLLVAGTDAGVCAVFLGDDEAALEGDLHERFPGATFVRDAERVRPWAEQAARRAAGEAANDAAGGLPLDLTGTDFQRRVWDALVAIPQGETRTYAQVAEAIGRPSAVRAVARACASNPVALFVPCHRVVRSDGSLSGYRWGVERKRVLLAAEAC